MAKNIKIIYCPVWNYLPRAARLAVEIKKAVGAEAICLPGDSGQFDVMVDDQVIFSRFETGRFPEEQEIIKMLKNNFANNG